MQNLNKRRPGHNKRLAQHHKLWARLFAKFLCISQLVLERGGSMSLEWPSTCSYWKFPQVTRLLESNLPWSIFKVPGCAHGLKVKKGTHASKYLAKSWRVATTVPGLQTALE